MPRRRLSHTLAAMMNVAKIMTTPVNSNRSTDFELEKYTI